MSSRSCTSARSRIPCASVIKGLSGGIVARAIQAPFAYWKKSSPGRVETSIAVMSRPTGGYSGALARRGGSAAAWATDTESVAQSDQRAGNLADTALPPPIDARNHSPLRSLRSAGASIVLFQRVIAALMIRPSPRSVGPAALRRLVTPSACPEAVTRDRLQWVAATAMIARVSHSVMMRSAHSTSDTKTVGLPNFAPHCSRSVSDTPRAREQTPQA
jgi:hypothetical protein